MRCLHRRRGLVGVRGLDRVEHAPEHIELETEDLACPLLQRASIEVVEGQSKAMVHVTARFGEASPEIGEAFGVDPRIMLRPVGKTLLVNLGRKHFRERRTDGFLPRTRAGEVHVGIDRETHPGYDMPQRRDLGARKPYGLPKLDPGLDPAFIAAATVMVEDTLDPLAADFAIRAVREHRRVLDWNANLIVVTVRHPAADLGRGGEPVRHALVERMMYVVAIAKGSQAGLERLAVEDSAHKASSMPSKATSILSCSNVRRSSEFSSRIGLVLLMWMRIRRAFGKVLSHSIIPPGPDC